nr:PsiF family protein [Methylobacillus flagellatus]
MKNCLSSGPELAGNTQQQKMKTCNAEAGKQDLSGEARKAFMKRCLSAK